jgi:hypothetical protein
MQVLRKHMEVQMASPPYYNKNYNFLGINCIVTEILEHYCQQDKYCASSFAE